MLNCCFYFFKFVFYLSDEFDNIISFNNFVFSFGVDVLGMDNDGDFGEMVWG